MIPTAGFAAIDAVCGICSDRVAVINTRFAAIAAAAALLAGSPAWASQGAQTTWSGTVEGGGSIGFAVSADGTTLKPLGVALPRPSPCGVLVVVDTINAIQIVNQTFSYGFPALQLTGAFPSPGTAQGTVQGQNPDGTCATTVANWTATQSPAVAPVATVSGPTSQRVRETLSITVTSNAFGTVTAGGIVKKLQGRRAPTIGSLPATPTTQVTPNAPVRLQVPFPARVRKQARKAIKQHKRVRAVITVIGTDTAGRPMGDHLTIKLRRR